MKGTKLNEGRPWMRALHLVGAALVTVGVSSAMGCGDSATELPGTGGKTTVKRLNPGSVDTIDLLLDIDNSRLMADKHEILAQAVPDLVTGLLNPRCLDKNGVPAAGQDQPKGPLEECPPGTLREFKPIVDVHIGIISSSLGGHGGTLCPKQDTACPNGTSNYSNNDKGHLIARKDPCSGGDVPTYQEKGFLAWDPGKKLMPAGESDMNNLAQTLKDMVMGAGQIGCGLEAQLESWYRFLVDPEPYETISVVGSQIKVEGIDQVLLEQRRAFLRPNSLLAIIMLSDENDCSVKEFGEVFRVANTTRLRRPRAECATNPNDPCCLPCGMDQGSCPKDPTCYESDGKPKTLTEQEDPFNLRCFDQKRRFGIDFLHPIDRYTQALTSLHVSNRAGELVKNPIFSDLNPSDKLSDVRDKGLVFLAGIVGVPWQNIARDKDLKKGFKTSDELLARDAMGLTTWDIILGDPDGRGDPDDPMSTAPPVLPKDPHMIVSIDPRTGVNPITGDPTVPPGQEPTNPINGAEWTITERDDLQYACIFPLPTPKNCADPVEAGNCDCANKVAAQDNPLCADNPAQPGERSLQIKAKAYPGLRELQVLKEVGTQGITASVCPAQLTAPTEADYGYRPAVHSIIDRLKEELGGRCLQRTLRTEGGRAPCLIIEAGTTAGGAEQCNCNEAGRQPVEEKHMPAVTAVKNEQSANPNWNCFCEIKQLDGKDLEACQNDPDDPPVNPETQKPVDGWCYVDQTTVPPIGAADLVAHCPETQKHRVRLVGDGGPKSGATLFLSCPGE